MGIYHYFAGDGEKRARFIFDFIAPVYGVLDKQVAKGFSRSIDKLAANIDIKDTEVLDVGTGTGAWGSLFLEKGAKNVTGVDFSPKMIRQAEKNHKNMKFFLADAKNLNIFDDNSFDIVTASYVLHGTKKDMREKILQEMKRVSRKYVVIHDFMGKTHFAVRILEWLERSDFVNFKKSFAGEMHNLFPVTKQIEVGGGSGLYIGQKK